MGIPRQGDNMTQPTVLIADDVEELRLLLKKTVETLGFSVIALVEDGNEAVAKIKELNPDISFIDIEMPGKSGIDVLNILKASQSKTFPVIISGNSTVDNVKKVIELGAKGFIVKPYSFDKVKQITDKYLESIK